MNDLARTTQQRHLVDLRPLDAPLQKIPRQVHQLWKTNNIPKRWRSAVASIKRHHKKWAYRLWTDAAIDCYVRQHHPGLYPVFAGFERNIMRADVFRYILMHDIGGVYCDLDYEFVRPYEYADADVILSLERDKSYGYKDDSVANYFFASKPGHPLWKDILDDLQNSPPKTETYLDVVDATGPGLVSRVLWRNWANYQGVMLTEKPVFSPQRIHGRYERKAYCNSGITYGFHHGSGSWKDRWSMTYLKAKAIKLLRL